MQPTDSTHTYTPRVHATQYNGRDAPMPSCRRDACAPVRHYVNYWTPEQMHVLDVRPGITDPASIKFFNENELLEQAENPEKYYIEVIMQQKISLYLEYVEKHNFFYDLALIVKTFWAILYPTVPNDPLGFKPKRMKRIKRNT